jgi:hypothetical protein
MRNDELDKSRGIQKNASCSVLTAAKWPGTRLNRYKKQINMSKPNPYVRKFTPLKFISPLIYQQKT